MAMSVGLKGPCPVCGAPEMSCGGTGEPGLPRGTIGAGFFLGVRAPDPAAARFRSRVEVLEEDGIGHTLIKYPVGAPIPLAEALRQGVATWEGLDRADVEALARHGIHPPSAAPPTPQQSPQPTQQDQAPAPPSPEPAPKPRPKMKAKDKPDRDRMVREGQVVRK